MKPGTTGKDDWIQRRCFTIWRVCVSILDVCWTFYVIVSEPLWPSGLCSSPAHTMDILYGFLQVFFFLRGSFSLSRSRSHASHIPWMNLWRTNNKQSPHEDDISLGRSPEPAQAWEQSPWPKRWWGHQSEEGPSCLTGKGQENGTGPQANGLYWALLSPAVGGNLPIARVSTTRGTLLCRQNSTCKVRLFLPGGYRSKSLALAMGPPSQARANVSSWPTGKLG